MQQTPVEATFNREGRTISEIKKSKGWLKIPLHPGPIHYWYSPRKKRFWITLAVILYTLAGFLLVPVIAKHQLQQQLSQLLQRQVSVESLRFNPYSLTIQLDHFAISDSDNSVMAGFDQLRINFQVSSLFHQAWTFREVTLTHPYGQLNLRKDGRTNFHDLIPPSTEQEKPDASGALPPVIVQSLVITRGELDFSDVSKPTVFSTKINDLNFQLDNLSTLPAEKGKLAFEAVSEQGASLKWQGNIQLNPLLIEGSLHAKGGYLPLAYRYFQDDLNITVAEADIDLSLQHRLSLEGKSLSANINNLKLSLANLAISDKNTGEQLLFIPSTLLTDLDFAWPEKTIKASQLHIEGPELRLSRLADNSLNLQHLLADSGKVNDPSSADTEPTTQTAPSPWKMSLTSASLNDMRLVFEDHSLANLSIIDISDLDLSVSNISNQPRQQMPLTAEIALAKGGTIAISGDISPLPTLQLATQATLSNLPLALAQPYASEYATIAINDGLLSAKTLISISQDTPFDVKGNLNLAQLDVTKQNSELPLLSWQDIRVEDAHYSLANNHLEVNSVTLDQPAVRIRIREDRTTNFQRLLVERAPGELPETEPDTQNESKPFSMVVGKIDVKDGATDFSDKSLPIPFKTDISSLQGQINNIDTTSLQPATLKFQGQIADYGLAKIDGELLPNDVTEQADIKLLLRNIAMPDLSPYTIKFAGYKIASGRMNLDLRYQLQQGKLVGDNNIVLTDVKLGEKTPHKDALDLPLGLALALLTDVNGKIDIDLPVKGDTDNPTFSIGSIVGKAIGNLLTKAITAPFRLLGALVGASSEDFGKAEFEPGISTLTPPEKEKIAQLSQALVKRPELVLKVRGAYSEKEDQLALQTKQVDDNINEQLATEDKLTPEARQGVLERLYLSAHPDEELKALRQPFYTQPAADSDEKPRLDRSAYNADLRQRLISETPIEDSQLHLLAQARAQAVADELITNSGLGSDRVAPSSVETVKPTKSGWIPLKLDLDTIRR